MDILLGSEDDKIMEQYKITRNQLSGYKRTITHKKKVNKGSFTARYNANRVVYYETFTDIYNPINREKQIKNYSRKRKIELIESINPEWKDLVEES